MGEVVLVAVALGVGFLFAFALMRWRRGDGREELERLEALREQLGEARVGLARVEAERDAARGQLIQHRQDRETLKAQVRAISAEQLEHNRDEFLKQAAERFGRSEQQHTAELAKRHEAIEKEFQGLRGTMEKFDRMQRDIEEKRSRAFGTLSQQFTALAEQTEAVRSSSEALSTALRGSSQSRGKWGEMALRNIVETAGMTEHCDFEEQSTDDDARPDMIVRLPDGGRVPIDAKVPYADYDRSLAETDPEQRARALEAHGNTVRRTMIELARRDYPSSVDGKVDFTVMFIPIESVAAAAFEVLPDLQQQALEKKVIIATPVTLIALLKTVGLYWRQEKLASNAREIWDEARELHRRLKIFHGHLAKAGRGMETAVKAFNGAVGSFERKVMPKARSIEALSGLSPQEALPELDPLAVEPRQVLAPAEPQLSGPSLVEP